MLLDYRTSLYYDAQEVDTLYEEGKPIKSGRISGEASARQLWETKVKSWNDYFLQGGHYALPAFQAGAFVNPMDFSEGSCFGTPSNCQIMALDGPAQIAKAAIFLGNTGADQTAVPQNADWALKMLDPDSKAAMLDTLLTRAEGADDAHMIAIVDQVVREPEFGNDLIVKKLQEVAGRETPAVRAEACRALRGLKHPCGKRSGRAPATSRPTVVRQETKPATASELDAYRLHTAIPKYIVFAHFLLMIHGMDEDKFVAAFRLRSLRRSQLDALGDEAPALTRELTMLDLRAQRVTAQFRRTGKLALRERKPLPLPPSSSAPASKIDPHTIGTCELSSNPGRWVWEIAPNGTYEFYSEAPDLAPSNAGTFLGKWRAFGHCIRLMDIPTVELTSFYPHAPCWPRGASGLARGAV